MISKPIRLVSFHGATVENVLDLIFIFGEGADYAMSKMRQR